jgi:hypothetical protein
MECYTRRIVWPGRIMFINKGCQWFVPLERKDRHMDDEMMTPGSNDMDSDDDMQSEESMEDTESTDGDDSETSA